MGDTADAFAKAAKVVEAEYEAPYLAHAQLEPPSALARFADSSPSAFVSGVRAVREQVVARKDEDRETFLRRRGFSKPETEKIIATVLREEGRPPESVFDFVQGITALARSKPHQDARLELESKAAKLMAAAA